MARFKTEQEQELEQARNDVAAARAAQKAGPPPALLAEVERARSETSAAQAGLAGAEGGQREHGPRFSTRSFSYGRQMDQAVNGLQQQLANEDAVNVRLVNVVQTLNQNMQKAEARLSMLESQVSANRQ